MICTFLQIFPLFAQSPARTNVVQPSIDTILSNVIARYQIVSTQRQTIYNYKQTTIIEELDSKGVVKERKEKYYDVKLIGGMPRAKLLLVNGKQLTGKALKEEEERDKKRAQRFDEKKDTPEYEVLVSKELISRYNFRFKGVEELNGRASYILSFAPRSDDLPIDKMQDRVLNKLSGMVWVDCEDFEVARADLHLSDRVKLLGGFIGALDIFDLELNRSRSPYGAWYNQLGSLKVEGRKLFSPIRFKAQESADEFKLSDPAPITKAAR
ncbi:MAG TPA: hypothetical protein VGH19_10370 [Verrucomicrobiae bacterium]